MKIHIPLLLLQIGYAIGSDADCHHDGRYKRSCISYPCKSSKDYWDTPPYGSGNQKKAPECETYGASQPDSVNTNSVNNWHQVPKYKPSIGSTFGANAAEKNTIAVEENDAANLRKVTREPDNDPDNVAEKLYVLREVGEMKTDYSWLMQHFGHDYYFYTEPSHSCPRIKVYSSCSYDKVSDDFDRATPVNYRSDGNNIATVQTLAVNDNNIVVDGDKDSGEILDYFYVDLQHQYKPESNQSTVFNDAGNAITAVNSPEIIEIQVGSENDVRDLGSQEDKQQMYNIGSHRMPVASLQSKASLPELSYFVDIPPYETVGYKHIWKIPIMRPRHLEFKPYDELRFSTNNGFFKNTQNVDISLDKYRNKDNNLAELETSLQYVATPPWNLIAEDVNTAKYYNSDLQASMAQSLQAMDDSPNLYARVLHGSRPKAYSSEYFQLPLTQSLPYADSAHSFYVPPTIIPITMSQRFAPTAQSLNLQAPSSEVDSADLESDSADSESFTSIAPTLLNIDASSLPLASAYTMPQTGTRMLSFSGTTAQSLNLQAPLSEVLEPQAQIDKLLVPLKQSNKPSTPHYVYLQAPLSQSSEVTQPTIHSFYWQMPNIHGSKATYSSHLKALSPSLPPSSNFEINSLSQSVAPYLISSSETPLVQNSDLSTESSYISTPLIQSLQPTMAHVSDLQEPITQNNEAMSHGSKIQETASQSVQPIQAVVQPITDKFQLMFQRYQPKAPISNLQEPITQNFESMSCGSKIQEPVSQSFQPISQSSIFNGPFSQSCQPMAQSFDKIESASQSYQPMAQISNWQEPITVQSITDNSQLMLQSYQPIADISNLQEPITRNFEPESDGSKIQELVSQSFQPITDNSILLQSGQPTLINEKSGQPDLKSYLSVLETDQPMLKKKSGQLILESYLSVLQTDRPTFNNRKSGQPIPEKYLSVLQTDQPILQSTQIMAQNGQIIAQDIQPMLQNGQPVLQSGQPMLQSGQPMLQSNQPMLQSSQPMLQSAQPMLQRYPQPEIQNSLLTTTASAVTVPNLNRRADLGVFPANPKPGFVCPLHQHFLKTAVTSNTDPVLVISDTCPAHPEPGFICPLNSNTDALPCPIALPLTSDPNYGAPGFSVCPLNKISDSISPQFTILDVNPVSIDSKYVSPLNGWTQSVGPDTTSFKSSFDFNSPGLVPVNAKPISYLNIRPDGKPLGYDLLSKVAFTVPHVCPVNPGPGYICPLNLNLDPFSSLQFTPRFEQPLNLGSHNTKAGKLHSSSTKFDLVGPNASPLKSVTVDSNVFFKVPDANPEPGLICPFNLKKEHLHSYDTPLTEYSDNVHTLNKNEDSVRSGDSLLSFAGTGECPANTEHGNVYPLKSTNPVNNFASNVAFDNTEYVTASDPKPDVNLLDRSFNLVTPATSPLNSDSAYLYSGLTLPDVCPANPDPGYVCPLSLVGPHNFLKSSQLTVDTGSVSVARHARPAIEFVYPLNAAEELTAPIAGKLDSSLLSRYTMNPKPGSLTSSSSSEQSPPQVSPLFSAETQTPKCSYQFESPKEQDTFANGLYYPYNTDLRLSRSKLSNILKITPETPYIGNTLEYPSSSLSNVMLASTPLTDSADLVSDLADSESLTSIAPTLLNPDASSMPQTGSSILSSFSRDPTRAKLAQAPITLQTNDPDRFTAAMPETNLPLPSFLPKVNVQVTPVKPEPLPVPLKHTTSMVPATRDTTQSNSAILNTNIPTQFATTMSKTNDISPFPMTGTSDPIKLTKDFTKVNIFTPFTRTVPEGPSFTTDTLEDRSHTRYTSELPETNPSAQFTPTLPQTNRPNPFYTDTLDTSTPTQFISAMPASSGKIQFPLTSSENYLPDQITSDKIIPLIKEASTQTRVTTDMAELLAPKSLATAIPQATSPTKLLAETDYPAPSATSMLISNSETTLPIQFTSLMPETSTQLTSALPRTNIPTQYSTDDPEPSVLRLTDALTQFATNLPETINTTQFTSVIPEISGTTEFTTAMSGVIANSFTATKPEFIAPCQYTSTKQGMREEMPANIFCRPQAPRNSNGIEEKEYTRTIQETSGINQLASTVPETNNPGQVITAMPQKILSTQFTTAVPEHNASTLFTTTMPIPSGSAQFSTVSPLTIDPAQFTSTLSDNFPTEFQSVIPDTITSPTQSMPKTFHTQCTPDTNGPQYKLVPTWNTGRDRSGGKVNLQDHLIRSTQDTVLSLTSPLNQFGTAMPYAPKASRFTNNSYINTASLFRTIPETNSVLSQIKAVVPETPNPSSFIEIPQNVMSPTFAATNSILSPFTTPVNEFSSSFETMPYSNSFQFDKVGDTSVPSTLTSTTTGMPETIIQTMLNPIEVSSTPFSLTTLPDNSFLSTDAQETGLLSRLKTLSDNTETYTVIPDSSALSTATKTDTGSPPFTIMPKAAALHSPETAPVEQIVSQNALVSFQCFPSKLTSTTTTMPETIIQSMFNPIGESSTPFSLTTLQDNSFLSTDAQETGLLSRLKTMLANTNTSKFTVMPRSSALSIGTKTDTGLPSFTIMPQAATLHSPEALESNLYSPNTLLYHDVNQDLLQYKPYSKSSMAPTPSLLSRPYFGSLGIMPKDSLSAPYKYSLSTSEPILSDLQSNIGNSYSNTIPDAEAANTPATIEPVLLSNLASLTYTRKPSVSNAILPLNNIVEQSEPSIASIKNLPWDMEGSSYLAKPIEYDSYFSRKTPQRPCSMESLSRNSYLPLLTELFPPATRSEDLSFIAKPLASNTGNTDAPPYDPIVTIKPLVNYSQEPISYQLNSVANSNYGLSPNLPTTTFEEETVPYPKTYNLLVNDNILSTVSATSASTYNPYSTKPFVTPSLNTKVTFDDVIIPLALSAPDSSLSTNSQTLLSDYSAPSVSTSSASTYHPYSTASSVTPSLNTEVTFDDVITPLALSAPDSSLLTNSQISLSDYSAPCTTDLQNLHRYNSNDILKPSTMTQNTDQNKMIPNLNSIPLIGSKDTDLEDILKNLPINLKCKLQSYLDRNPKKINNELINSKTSTADLGNICYGKYIPDTGIAYPTEDPRVWLKSWYSLNTVLKPALMFKTEQRKTLNFLPIVEPKYMPYFKSPDLVQNLANEFITRHFTQPYVVKGVFSADKPYAAINIGEASDKAAILWPTFCSCGCNKAGCRCQWK